MKPYYELPFAIKLYPVIAQMFRAVQLYEPQVKGIYFTEHTSSIIFFDGAGQKISSEVLAYVPNNLVSLARRIATQGLVYVFYPWMLTSNKQPPEFMSLLCLTEFNTHPAAVQVTQKERECLREVNKQFPMATHIGLNKDGRLVMYLDTVPFLPHFRNPHFERSLHRLATDLPKNTLFQWKGDLLLDVDTSAEKTPDVSSKDMAPKREFLEVFTLKRRLGISYCNSIGLTNDLNERQRSGAYGVVSVELTYAAVGEYNLSVTLKSRVHADAMMVWLEDKATKSYDFKIIG